MKVLVTGSEGRLGSQIGNKIDIMGLDKSGAEIEADITDDSVIDEIEEVDPDVIVHAAAIHAGESEKNPGKAKKVNVEGTRNISTAAEITNAHIIFMSSSHVFSGTQESVYTEKDKPDPVLEYGKTKLEGEKIVSSCKSSTILRSSIVYGSSSGGEASSGNFFSWARNELNQDKEVEIITDQVNNPIFIEDLADIVVESAEKKIQGLYHVAGASKISRYKSIKKLKQIHGLRGSVKPITKKELGWEKRGNNYAMSIEKLKTVFETEPSSIEKGFKKWKSNLEI